MTSSNEILPEEEDYETLNRLLDRIKGDIFLGKNSQGQRKLEFISFFGSLLSSLDYIWDHKIKTANTNGIRMCWSPKFFLLLPHGTRLTVFMHELWHVARMDTIWVYGKNFKRWNAACDIWINNTLDNQGYSFEGIPFKFWLDHSYDGWTAEDIYDDLKKKDDEEWEQFCKDLGVDPDNFPWEDIEVIEGDGDSDVEGGKLTVTQNKIISNVLQANQAAQQAGEDSPEAVQETIKQFLKPKVNWARELWAHFDAKLEEDFVWHIRDRRFRDVYLPDLHMDEGLEDLFFGMDVSGSMDTPEVTASISEVRYIWQTFKPKTLTLFQFDTIVQRVDVFEEDAPLNEFVVQGRGGTSLRLVADYIEEHKPPCAIIFTDLYCDPMRIVADVDIIWIVFNNPNATVNQGKMIHIRV